MKKTTLSLHQRSTLARFLVQGVCCSLLTFTLLSWTSTAVAQTATQAAVVLDRTGSMLLGRSTGNTRCEDALALAEADVESFFLANPEAGGSSVAIFIFGGMGVENLTGGFVNEANALAALAQLDPVGCDGATPLADALCEASDSLAQTFPNAAPGDLLLAVSSDGGENNSTGICSGPDSAASTVPYSPGSWQNLVFAKLSVQSVIDVRYWDDFASVNRRTTKIAGDPPVPAQAARDSLKTPTDLSFFQALTNATGGNFSRQADGQPVGIPTLSITSMGILLSLLGFGGWAALRRRGQF